MSKKKKDAKNIFDTAAEIFSGEEARRKKLKKRRAEKEAAEREEESVVEPSIVEEEVMEPVVKAETVEAPKKKKKKKEKVYKEDLEEVKSVEAEVLGDSSLVAKLTPEAKREDLKGVYDELNKLRSNLEEKLDAMFKKAKVTKEELDHYLENPGNFSARQWEAMEKTREEEKAKAWGTLSPEEQKRALEREQKREKRKSLGGRKKGWFRVD